ncbi:MAG: DUF2806 domain-containing protein [Stenotrophomonas lactitubi]|uniref:DUF2806 domain-containing protein n=1 Tax=Stenotrophomonas lactitubi TaxID=2045214 RepID=UPI003D1240B4
MDYPGEKFLIRLLDIIERNGISPFVDSWKTRRDGMAAIDVQRAQALMLAQVEVEIARLKSDGLAIPNEADTQSAPRLGAPGSVISDGALGNTAGLAKEAFTYEAVRSLRREANVGKAIARAAEALLECDGAPPQAEPDPDWLERWRDNASGVASEKMQDLWGQVLAREVQQPGSLSLRAMDLLRNLDSSDAARIERLALFVLDNRFVYKNPDSSGNGLSFAEAMALQELGILAGVDSGFLVFTLDSVSESEFVRGITLGKYGIGLRASDPEISVSLDGYKVTSVGREILTLVDVEPDRAYLEEVASAIKLKGVTVHFGTAEPLVGEGGFNLNDPIEL